MLCKYTNLQPSEFHNLGAQERVAFVELAIELAGAKPVDSKRIDPNEQKIFPNGPPGDPDVRDLALRINSAKGTDRSKSEIASEITKESIGEDPKAQRLLNLLRAMKQRGTYCP